MKVALFCHSILSDWNHGNAHFLRGICTELLARGHKVRTFEAKDAWSVTSCVADHGHDGLSRVRDVYPHLNPTIYDLDTLDLDDALDGIDLVLVHEWSPHALVHRIGEHRARVGHYRLLFHDTHHRAVTDPDSMAKYDLSSFDGVLAFGEVLRRAYLSRGWIDRAWTWHEAADTRVFRPHPEIERTGDLVWVGNFGDDERTQELEEFLLGPVKDLGLTARVYGVRYPDDAKARLRAANVEYGGWLPNYDAPQVFAHYRMTVHVPRLPYVRALPGIPTIRPFETLACGIPLVSAPWIDSERLFTPGRDFLVAANGDEMKQNMRAILADPQMAAEIARHGRRTVLGRHTCAHRVDELLGICAELGIDVDAKKPGEGPRRTTRGAEAEGR
jgi:spore maturation protein CgeB